MSLRVSISFEYFQYNYILYQTIPPIAAGGPGWMWESGLSLNPWNPNFKTAGSSAGSATAVASNVVAIAITEDTGGSTSGPAARNHNFGYDPPKFHYPK